VLHPSLPPKEVAGRLRDVETPVAVRVEDGTVVVDLRTVLESQERDLHQAFLSLT
jgi:hypothetical protein